MRHDARPVQRDRHREVVGPGGSRPAAVGRLRGRDAGNEELAETVAKVLAGAPPS